MTYGGYPARRSVAERVRMHFVRHLEQASPAPGGVACIAAPPEASAIEALIYAIEEGTIPVKRVEDALTRQRRVKERFLAPPRPQPLSGSALRTLVGRDEHQAIAAEMARFA